MSMKTITLTDKQIDTIKSALRTDYQQAKTLGALPIGQELQEDIVDAYRALPAKEETGEAHAQARPQ